MAPLILVIDDEEPVRAVLRQMLEKEGYKVEEAPDGALGMSLLQDHPIDLIITDLFMPEKEGIETMREVQKSFPQVKIIAMSGGGRMGKLDFLPMAESFGAQRTLAKPFERKELLEAVRAVLAQLHETIMRKEVGEAMQELPLHFVDTPGCESL